MSIMVREGRPPTGRFFVSSPPRVNGAAGRAALELAARVMAGIQEHARRVQLDAVVSQENR